MKGFIKSTLYAFLVLSVNILCSIEKRKMPQLVYPKNLEVNNGRILITDYPNVYIYSINNVELIKKFGKKGEGPGEFYVDQISMNTKLAGLVSGISKENIYVNSQGRLTFFNLNGNVLNIKRLKHMRAGGRGFRHFGDRFLSYRTIRDEKKLYSTIKMFDGSLNEIKEIYRTNFWIESFQQFRSAKFNFFERANGVISFVTNAGLIYVSRNKSSDIHIDVLDSDGVLLKKIEFKTKKRKIKQSLISDVFNYYKIKFRRGLKANIKATEFPENYPGLRKFFVDDGKIYILTYKREKDNNEIILLDLEGKFIRKTNIPVYEANPEHLYPCSVYKGCFYQIREIEEEEDWELHITKI